MSSASHPLLVAWHAAAMDLLPPGIEIWDAHTHTGDTDPDGFSNTPEDLLAALDEADQAGAVIMTAADPAGYPNQNDRIRTEADSSNGRLVPFLRVDPNRDEAVDEVLRSLDEGHRGVKLHPRSEAFGLGHPAVIDVAAVAAGRRVPVLVHAGRGIDSLGRDALRLVDRVDGLSLILAHCAISDLGTLSDGAQTRSGLLFDTAWWNPADIGALFGSVDASQILYASDMPYGSPSWSVTLTIRAAVQAGLGGTALAAVFGGNLRRTLAGEPLHRMGVGVPHRPDPKLGNWRGRDATCLPLIAKLELRTHTREIARLGFKPHLALVDR